MTTAAGGGQGHGETTSFAHGRGSAEARTGQEVRSDPEVWRAAKGQRFAMGLANPVSKWCLGQDGEFRKVAEIDWFFSRANCLVKLKAEDASVQPVFPHVVVCEGKGICARSWEAGWSLRGVSGSVRASGGVRVCACMCERRVRERQSGRRRSRMGHSIHS